MVLPSFSSLRCRCRSSTSCFLRWTSCWALSRSPFMRSSMTFRSSIDSKTLAGLQTPTLMASWADAPAAGRSMAREARVRRAESFMFRSFQIWWAVPTLQILVAAATLRVEGFTNLLSEAKREAEEAGLVMAIFGDREAEIESDRHLAKERKGQPESKPHAGTDCTHFEFAVHGAGVEKDHATEQVGREWEVELGRSGSHEVTPDGVVIDAGTGADASIFEAPDAADAAEIESLKKRGVTGDIPRIGADGQNCAAIEKVLINCGVVVE